MRSSILCATLALGLVLSSPALAEETKQETKEQEPETRRTAWPIVLGASSVALGATSVYFYMQWNDYQDRGAEIAKRVPKNEAPCDPGGDRDFCATDEKARVASNLMLVTGAASLAALGTAIALYVLESKPSKTAVTPVVAPGYGGAAFVTSF